MASLKADNDRLQRIVVSKGDRSPSSSTGSNTLEKRMSLGDSNALGGFVKPYIFLLLFNALLLFDTIISLQIYYYQTHPLDTMAQRLRLQSV